jgi:hypothetical protein
MFECNRYGVEGTRPTHRGFRTTASVSLSSPGFKRMGLPVLLEYSQQLCCLSISGCSSSSTTERASEG